MLTSVGLSEVARAGHPQPHTEQMFSPCPGLPSAFHGALANFASQKFPEHPLRQALRQTLGLSTVRDHVQPPKGLLSRLGWGRQM